MSLPQLLMLKMKMLWWLVLMLLNGIAHKHVDFQLILLNLEMNNFLGKEKKKTNLIEMFVLLFLKLNNKMVSIKLNKVISKTNTFALLINLTEKNILNWKLYLKDLKSCLFSILCIENSFKIKLLLRLNLKIKKVINWSFLSFIHLFINSFKVQWLVVELEKNYQAPKKLKQFVKLLLIQLVYHLCNIMSVLITLIVIKN